MPYQPITKDRVCGWTYVKEKDLPEGQKLLACSRCNEVWYQDRECQLAHWPYHRKSCKSLRDEQESSIHDPILDLTTCLQSLSAIFIDGMRDLSLTGRSLLHAFRELKRHVSREELSEEDHLILRNMGVRVFSALSQCITKYGRDKLCYDVWAIPGFASYFLSEDLFLSPVMKYRQEHGIPAFGEPVSIDSEARGVRVLPMMYTSIIQQLYGFSMSQFWLDTVSGQLLAPKALVAALTRSANRAWTSEYARASLSWEENFHIRFFEDFFQKPLKSNLLREWCAPNELVPGLAAKQLLTTLMKDSNFLHRMDPDRRSEFLGAVYSFCAYFEDNENLPWSHLTEKERIELLDIAQDWEAPKKKCVQDTAEFFTNVKTTISHMITGTQTKVLLKMYDLCQTMEVDERTVKMIKKIRNAILLKQLPRVAVYTETIESLAHKKGINHSLPEVLSPMIAELSMEPRYIWASNDSAKKGLRFLTQDELDQHYRKLRKLTSDDREAFKENIYDTTPGLVVPVEENSYAGLWRVPSNRSAHEL